MNRSRNQRALKLFERSRDLPSEQVASFLDQACGDDDRLRAEVESLLATYHDVDKVLPTTDQHHPSTFSGVDDAKVFRRTKTGDYRLEPGLLLLDRYAIEASIRPSHSDSQERGRFQSKQCSSPNSTRISLFFAGSSRRSNRIVVAGYQNQSF